MVPSSITTLGPTAGFPAIEVDTWTKWWGVATYMFFDHLIAHVAGMIVPPFMTTHVQNDESSFDLDLHGSSVQRLAQIYNFASWVDNLIYTLVMLSQFELLFFGFLAEAISTYLVNRRYIKEYHVRHPPTHTLSPHQALGFRKLKSMQILCIKIKRTTNTMGNKPPGTAPTIMHITGTPIRTTHSPVSGDPRTSNSIEFSGKQLTTGQLLLANGNINKSATSSFTC
jgi:hypothetical protein